MGSGSGAGAGARTASNQGVNVASDDAADLGDLGVEQTPEGRLSRRRALKWLIRLGYGAFALAFALPAFALRALQTEKTETADGDRLVRSRASSGANAGDPVIAADIPAGGSVQVFPQGKTDNTSNLIQVVRLAAGEGADGLVAYSAICTHLGCPVYEELNQQGQIACPCHGSRFDPANNAAVIGGPANRPLPAIPVGVAADGSLMLAGAFSGPIGPE